MSCYDGIVLRPLRHIRQCVGEICTGLSVRTST